MGKEKGAWLSVGAMVVADVVHRDGASGKHSILGIYNSINSPKFPCTHPRLCVYLALMGGRASTPLRLRLIDVDEEHDPVFASDAVMPFTDPTQLREFSFTAERIVFPEPSEYRLQLFVEDILLHEHRIYVRQG